MTYQAKDYSRVLGMQGISDTTLQNHFKLYQGYVTNTNTLLDTSMRLSGEGKEKSPEFAEVRRRLGFEFCGMRLHEYYFENLKGTGAPEPNSAIYKQISKDFSDFDSWKNRSIVFSSRHIFPPTRTLVWRLVPWLVGYGVGNGTARFIGNRTVAPRRPRDSRVGGSHPR